MWMAAGTFWAVIAVLGLRWALTVYSSRPTVTPADPRELVLIHSVLTRALAGDSTGAVGLGATPGAVAWAMAAARYDSALVRGWIVAPETDITRVRGDTTWRTWYSTAALQRCSGAAPLAVVLLHTGPRLRVLNWSARCVPVAPITFEAEGNARMADSSQVTRP